MMEITLNCNFLAIENDSLELINGGMPLWKATILVTLGVVCVAWALPIALMVLADVGTIAALATGLSLVGLGFIGIGLGLNH